MRVVMTGATAGFGLFAAEQIVAAGHELIIGARGVVPDALRSRAEVRRLDLDSLKSVRNFAEGLGGGPSIDCLILNAGLQLAKPAISADGFERTFAVNHLAHYLLLRLLEGKFAENGRVILTGSGTHDPEEKTGVPPPIHANAEYLAFPERDPQQEKRARPGGFRAYSTSKLCNIMTAREAAKRQPDINFLSYDPGYVPHTGLGRDNPKWIATLVSYILPLVLKKDRSSTIPRSGRYLAELALDPRFAGALGDYWAVRSPDLVKIEPSTLARDDGACAKLWDDSAALVGL